MALSKDQKRRKKLEREGKLNPQQLRMNWGDIKPVERKTPTLSEKMARQQKKHKARWNSYGNDKDSTFFVLRVDIWKNEE